MLTHIYGILKKKKWFWRTSGQDRNKDTDVENGLDDMGRG